MATTPLNILDVDFDKSNIELYFILIFSILAKFQENQRLINMSSIEYLNLSFCILKLCIKIILWIK